MVKFSDIPRTGDGKPLKQKLDEALELLELYGLGTGDGCYIRGVAMIRGARSVPKTIDDSQNLAAMREMLDSGMAGTVERAARLVARSLEGKHSTTSAIKRMARKFRDQNK